MGLHAVKLALLGNDDFGIGHVTLLFFQMSDVVPKLLKITGHLLYNLRQLGRE